MAMEENLKKLLRRLRSSEKKARDKGLKDAEGKLEEVYRILEQDESLLKKALAKVDFSDRNALAGFVHFLMWLQVNHKREYVETILRGIIELPLPEGHSVEKAKKCKAGLYYLLAGYLSEDKNRLEESDQYYQKSLEQEPDFFHAQEEYASLLFRLGKFGDSVFHYKKALKLKKDSISTRLGYVLTLTLMGKFRSARKEYRLTARIAKRKNLLRSFLDDFEWMERGFIDIEEAIFLLQRKSVPPVFKIKYLCNRVRRFFESYDKQEKLESVGLDLKEASLGVLNVLEGILELKRKTPSPEKALLYLEKAECVFSDDINIKQNIAVAHWRCGFSDLASEEIDEVLDICRKNNRYYKSAWRLKRILEEVRDGCYRPPFPKIGWRFQGLVIVVLFWILFFLLPKIGVNFAHLEPFLNNIWILIVVSIVGVTVWIFYPFLWFIRGLKNIPWVGEVNLSPFLAEVPSEFLRCFVMDFEDKDKERRKQKRLELGIPPNIFP